MAENISRGIFFIEDDQYIEPPYEVTHYVLPEAPHEDVLGLLQRFGNVYAREPGIVVTRAEWASDARQQHHTVQRPSGERVKIEVM